MTEFLLSCAHLWPPSESDLGNGAQREQQPQLTLFVKLKCLSKAIFFTSILNLWRISYFLRFFNWLHGSCKPCADVSVGGRLRATRWTWVLAWPYGTCEKTNKLPANPIAGQVFSNLPNSIEDTRPCTCSVHVQEWARTHKNAQMWSPMLKAFAQPLCMPMPCAPPPVTHPVPSLTLGWVSLSPGIDNW